jgi:hypothetical protein
MLVACESCLREAGDPAEVAERPGVSLAVAAEGVGETLRVQAD